MIFEAATHSQKEEEEHGDAQERRVFTLDGGCYFGRVGPNSKAKINSTKKFGIFISINFFPFNSNNGGVFYQWKA